ncbi:MAG: O-antigen ligase domain-containing protein, partial [Flavobacteriaceae bacterium]|nr:O-antigen ligase domain-containing protein [Flavobacteriaceae bacterium]
MIKFILNNKLIFIVIHILLGYGSSLLRGSNILKIIWVLIIGVFILNIIFKSNRNEEAFLFAAYISAAEVFIRMSKGMILYETGKYSVILFLLLGIFVGKFKQKFSISLAFYLLLLLLGIVFTRVPEGEYIRKAIAFNL